MVDFDAAGRITGIGELKEKMIHVAMAGPGGSEAGVDITTTLDLGPMRGGLSTGAMQPDKVEPDFGKLLRLPLGGTVPAEIEVTLSAETKAEIPVGGLEKVLFRLELTSEAVPLAVSQPAPARPDVPIVVSLSVENEALAIDGDTEFTLAPPASQQPAERLFLSEGVRAGVSRLSVTLPPGRQRAGCYWFNCGGGGRGGASHSSPGLGDRSAPGSHRR